MRSRRRFKLIAFVSLVLSSTTVLPAQEREFTIQEVLALIGNGVAESRILALLTDGCVVRGNDTASQAALLAGGASARIRRAVERFTCVAPPTDSARLPSLSPAQRTSPAATPADAAAPFGLGDDQFVLIPSGTFTMGGGQSHDQKPKHLVTITRPFYLQRTEVTQAQWRSVMGNSPSFFSMCGDRCPVELVSWSDIQQFLARLLARTGRQYRLPTEAEWEYAARAGTTGDFGGTGSLEDMGWFKENSDGLTHAVGMKTPNEWGLFDMHGNVWEWTHDWYDERYYGRSPTRDPTGPAEGKYRVMRGGSWGFRASDAQSARRVRDTPLRRSSNVGFRLARTP